MITREVSMRKRAIAYGEQRQFRLLEAFAIRRRLKAARHLLNLLLESQPDAKLSVLEVGCGFWGSNLSLLQKENASIEFTGVDLSVSRDVKNVKLIQADISTWKPAREFDAVVSLAVIEHLIDPLNHFRLLAASVKQGGLIGLTTPSPQSHFILQMLAKLRIFDSDEIQDHKIYLTETAIRLCAAGADLSIEEYKPFSFGLNQWVLMRKN